MAIKVNITFAVKTNFGVSNRISKTVEISEELSDGLRRDSYAGGLQTCSWIKNNLFGTVVEQLNPSGDWTPIDPMVTQL